MNNKQRYGGIGETYNMEIDETYNIEIDETLVNNKITVIIIIYRFWIPCNNK